MERIIEDDIIRAEAQANSVLILLLETLRQNPVVYDDADLLRRTEDIANKLQDIIDILFVYNI